LAFYRTIYVIVSFMSKEQRASVEFRDTDISFEQARTIIFSAGEIALAETGGRDEKQIIVQELGRMFSKIDNLHELFELAKAEIGIEGESVVTLGSIMMTIDRQKNAIYQREEALLDPPADQARQLHPDLLAIKSFSAYLESSYYKVINKPGDNLA
jgi:hypothetical protein